MKNWRLLFALVLIALPIISVTVILMGYVDGSNPSLFAIAILVDSAAVIGAYFLISGKNKEE